MSDCEVLRLDRANSEAWCSFHMYDANHRAWSARKMIDAGQLLPKARILGPGKLPNPADQGCREVACCQLPPMRSFSTAAFRISPNKRAGRQKQPRIPRLPSGRVARVPYGMDLKVWAARRQAGLCIAGLIARNDCGGGSRQALTPESTRYGTIFCLQNGLLRRSRMRGQRGVGWCCLRLR